MIFKKWGFPLHEINFEFLFSNSYQVEKRPRKVCLMAMQIFLLGEVRMKSTIMDSETKNVFKYILTWSQKFLEISSMIFWR